MCVCERERKTLRGEEEKRTLATLRDSFRIIAIKPRESVQITIDLNIGKYNREHERDKHCVVSKAHGNYLRVINFFLYYVLLSVILVLFLS